MPQPKWGDRQACPGASRAGKSLGVNPPRPDCTAAYRGCSAVRSTPGLHLGSRAGWEEDPQVASAGRRGYWLSWARESQRGEGVGPGCGGP